MIRLFSKASLCVLLILSFFSQEVFSTPVDFELPAEDLNLLAQRNSRFFKIGIEKVNEYNPYAYYGYGYRPFWGNFGGYLGFFG